MAYETAARAEELLSLNVEDLDTEFRRARVVSKGGAIEYVHWATGTARLLPRLLQGRTSGPVFLADRRAPAEGRRAPAAADICPETGRGRLSYPRAEYLFKQATKNLDPHGIGWTLHQLRHSALQHLAVDGRTAPELQAKSRHTHLASLGRYVQLGEQTSAQLTADADPAPPGSGGDAAPDVEHRPGLRSRLPDPHGGPGRRELLPVFRRRRSAW